LESTTSPLIFSTFFLTPCHQTALLDSSVPAVYFSCFHTLSRYLMSTNQPGWNDVIFLLPQTFSEGQGLLEKYLLHSAQLFCPSHSVDSAACKCELCRASVHRRLVQSGWSSAFEEDVQYSAQIFHTYHSVDSATCNLNSTWLAFIAITGFPFFNFNF